MPRKGIQPFDRVQIVALLSARHTEQDVADRLNVTQSSVSEMWRKYREMSNVNDKSRSGCTHMTTPVQDCYPQISARRRPASTARQIGYNFTRATGMRISDQTVRRRLHQGKSSFQKTNEKFCTDPTDLKHSLINIGWLQNGGMSSLLTRPGLVWDRTLDVLGFEEPQEVTRNTDTFRKSIRLQVEV